jgi:hypothetical protein
VTEADEGQEDDLSGEDAPGTDALLSRLRVIEDQPLDRRASSFAQIHDELQSALEGGDAPVRNA